LRRRKRRKGFRDDHQRSIMAAYDEFIMEVVRRFPASDVSELALRGTELKKRWRKTRLSKGKLERKTVHEALKRLAEKRQVLKVGRRYILREYFGAPRDLHEKVKSALRNDRVEALEYVIPRNVAECAVITRPESSKGRAAVAELAELEAARLGKSLFGLEALVTYALKRGYIAPGAFHRSQIDWTALLSGLKRMFDDLDLFIFSFAVDVGQLLNFLSTRPGMKLASRLLAKRWDTIVERAKVGYERDRGMIINRMDTMGFQQMFAALKELTGAKDSAEELREFRAKKA
jgi:hypothetical protein